jgi:hypothetical protein
MGLTIFNSRQTKTSEAMKPQNSTVDYFPGDINHAPKSFNKIFVSCHISHYIREEISTVTLLFSVFYYSSMRKPTLLLPNTIIRQSMWFEDIPSEFHQDISNKSGVTLRTENIGGGFELKCYPLGAKIRLITTDAKRAFR